MELLPPPRINIKHGGFTLVELSIVMIIVGLLIGGIFGGMKLVDNANIQKTAQDLKSFDAAGLTFKDIYRALPGDMRNASTRLPNCNSTPCSTNGNGNRMIGRADYLAISDTDEEFVFWQHLLAAGLISNIKLTVDMSFGEGQPESSLNGGYRMIGKVPTVWASSKSTHLLWIGNKPNGSFASWTTDQDSLDCSEAYKLDIKMDDGLPKTGKVTSAGSCTNTTATDNTWQTTTGPQTCIWYNLIY